MCLRPHFSHQEVSQSRHDVLAEHETVVVRGHALAVHRHVLPLVAFGQLPDRGISGGFLQGHSLARLYASDDAGGFLAGLIGGQPSVPAHGDPLRAAEGAGLHNVDLGARRVDPNAETRKVTVPEP